MIVGLRASVSRRILHNPMYPSAHLELAYHQHQKEPTACTRFYVQDQQWIGNVFNSYPCDLISLHWILQQYLFLHKTSRWAEVVTSTTPPPQSRHLLDASSHVLHLTLVGHAKSIFVGYLYERLTSLAPTNKESAWAQ